jgi:hypothetical protein
MHNRKIRMTAARLVTWIIAALALAAIACAGDRSGAVTELQVSRRTPMMGDVSRWMDERHYDFITSHVDSDLVLSTEFADEPGKSRSCTCSFAINPNRDVLTVTASFSPAVSTGAEVTAFSWVANANDDSMWGFYGFDPEKHELWFRISLFRPEGRVESDELDRILNEVLSAMRNARSVLSPSSTGDSAPEDQEPIIPESEEPARSHLLCDERSETVGKFAAPSAGRTATI